jgi:hypothetical protein
MRPTLGPRHCARLGLASDFVLARLLEPWTGAGRLLLGRAAVGVGEARVRRRWLGWTSAATADRVDRRPRVNRVARIWPVCPSCHD